MSWDCKEHLSPNNTIMNINKHALYFFLLLLALAGISTIIASRILSPSTAKAEYAPSLATQQMSKDIKAAQEFVKEYETRVLDAKNKASIYRDTICKTEKEACTKEYLDPLNSGVDLSVFIIPNQES